jgi:type I restriction enzyme S subunit
MDALPVHARAVERIDYREFAGSGTRFKNGDTLIARITPCLENGKTAFVAELPDGAVGHGSTEYIVLAAKEKVSDGLYGYYLARSPDFRRYAIGHMEGTSGRQRVPSTAVEKYVVGLPPLPEQRAIAHILGTLDDKIELNRRMSETLEAMARALFKAWFVDFEPVRAKLEGRWQRGQSLPGLPAHLYDLFPDRLVDSELGEIPEGWGLGTLGDVLCQRMERCVASAKTAARPYVPIECISPKSLFLENSKPGEEAQSSLTKFCKGDLLFGAMRPYFHKVCIAPFDGTTRTTVFVLYPRRGTDFSFATMLLHHADTINFATRHSTGSTIPYSVWADSMDSMATILPPLEVRAAFNDAIRPMLARIPHPHFESRTLAVLRDKLLPKLISGELRVQDAERFISEGAA